MRRVGFALFCSVLTWGCAGSRGAPSPGKATSVQQGAVETESVRTQRGAVSCEQYPDHGKYWLRVQGDGDEQLFAEGTPISETGWRYCGPGGGIRGEQLIAMGCAEQTLTKRSCVFVVAPRVGYFDRQGVQHELTIATSSTTPTVAGVDGVFTTHEVLAGSSAPLRIEFHLPRCPWTESGMGCGPQCVSDGG